jgi:hypothetical protein
MDDWYVRWATGTQNPLEAWPTSMWGPKGEKKLADPLGNVFWNKKEMPLDMLARSFWKPKPKIPSAQETAAAEAKKKEEAKQKALSWLSSNRSQNVLLVANRIEGKGLPNRGQAIKEGISTCQVISIIGNGQEQELELVLPDQRSVSSLEAIKLLLPKREQEAEERAAMRKVSDRRAGFPEAEALLAHLFEVPDVRKRLDLMIETLQRRSVLQDSVRRYIDVFTENVGELLKLNFIYELLGRLLRSYNAARQGRSPHARAGLNLGVKGLPRKQPPPGGYGTPEALDAFRSRATTKGHVSLGSVIVEQMISEVSMEKGETLSHQLDKFKNRLRADAFGPDVYPKPRAGSDPLDDSIFFSGYKPLAEDWFSEADSALQIEKNRLESASKYIDQLYSTSSNPDDKVFAWRLDLLSHGIIAANAKLEKNTSEKSSDVGEVLYEKVLEAKDASDKNAINDSEDDHVDLLATVDKEMDDAYTNARQLLVRAGRKVPKDKAVAIIDATIVSRTMREILSDVRQAVIDYEKRLKSSKASTTPPEPPGLAYNGFRTLPKTTPATVPIGAQLYDSNGHGSDGATDTLPLYNDTKPTSVDEVHTRRFARRVEARLGLALRAAMTNAGAFIDPAIVQVTGSPSLIDATHALSAKMLSLERN